MNQSQNEKKAPATPSRPTAETTYDIADKTGAVRQIQNYLLELAYAEESYVKVPVDGIFGSETERAVRVFQEKNGLPVTGEVDFDTFTLLGDTCRECRAETVPTPLGDALPLSAGACGAEVMWLHAILWMLRERYPDLAMPQRTAVFSRQTERQIRHLQNCYGMEENGVVTARFLDRMLTDLYDMNQKEIPTE